MKKVILSTMMLALAASTVNGQDKTKKNDGGMYLRVGVGYAFPQAGDFLSGTESNTPTTYTVDMKKGSYSSGFNAALAAGYMFNRNIGVELAVGAGIANKKYTMEYDNTASGDYHETMTTYAKMPIMIMPSIVLSTGHTELEAYTRVGLAINVAGKFISEYEGIDRSGATDDIMKMTTEYKPNIGIGIQGAFGVKYHVSDMLGIYLELNGLSMTSYMKSSEVTMYENNGINELGLLSIHATQTEYSADYTETFSSSTPSTPSQAPAMSVPFSNLGLGIGVTINL